MRVIFLWALRPPSRPGIFSVSTLLKVLKFLVPRAVEETRKCVFCSLYEPVL